jgi:hypothetical protein
MNGGCDNKVDASARKKEETSKNKPPKTPEEKEREAASLQKQKANI